MSVNTPKSLQSPSHGARQPITLDAKPGAADKAARQNYRKYVLTTAFHKIEGLAKEIDAEHTRQTRVERPGLYIDESLFFGKRDLSVGVAGAGGVTVQTTVEPSILSFLFPIDSFLGRAVKLTNQTSNVAIPQLQAVQSPAFVAENAASAGSGATTFAQIDISPVRASSEINFSKQLLVQANPSQLDFVEQTLFAPLRNQLANAVLNGTGAANNQTQGIFGITPNSSGQSNYRQLAYTGVTFASSPTWNKVSSILTAVEGQNIQAKDIEFLTSPAAKQILLNTQIQSGFPQMVWDIVDGTIGGRPALTSTNVTSNQLLAADWSKYLLANWGLHITVDPYVLASNFQVRIQADLLWNGSPLYANAFGTSIDAV